MWKLSLIVYIVVCGNNKKYIKWRGPVPHTHQHVAKERREM